ncbi:MAG: hypothetical protein ABUL60_23030 [Myxococcales bacterium]
MHNGTIREVVLLGLPVAQEQNFLREAARYLERQFGVKMRPRAIGELQELKIDLATWSHPRASLEGFDRLFESVRKRGDFRLTLTARDWLAGAQSAVELLNRYQRLLPVSKLRAHALGVRFKAPSPPGAAGDAAEASHAHDTWRWAVRLSGSLSPGQLGSTRLLQDAHDLAFFSNGSVQYLQQHGVAATYGKVRRCLSRMSDEAICHALTTRQPVLISQMIEETLVMLARRDDEAATRASA